MTRLRTGVVPLSSLVSDVWFAFVPPVLLAAGWVALQVTGRRAGLKFFLSGAALAVVCVPAGVVIAWLQPPCHNPDHQTWACGYSVPALAGTLSAVLTAGTLVTLLLLTAFFNLVGVSPAADSRR